MSFFQFPRPVYSCCPSFSIVFPTWSFIVSFDSIHVPNLCHLIIRCYKFSNHFCILSFTIIDFPPYFFVFYFNRFQKKSRRILSLDLMSCPIILSLSWRLVIFQFFRFFWRPSVCRNPTPTKHSSLGCLDMHRFQKRAAPGDQPMPRISFQNVHGPRCEPWCWYIKTYKTGWFWMFGQMLVNIPAPWSIWGGFFSLSMFVRYFHVFTVLIFFPPVYRCLHGFS